MTDSCKHDQLLTFKDSKTQEPAGLWACAFCRARFVPLDLATEKDAKRYRWLRATDGTWMCTEGMPPDEIDAVIDADMDRAALRRAVGAA